MICKIKNNFVSLLTKDKRYIIRHYNIGHTSLGQKRSLIPFTYYSKNA